MFLNNLLKDQGGKPSSKRMFGAILLGLGLFFSVILFFYSLFFGATDARTATDIIDMLILSGAGLLGIGVFEKFRAKK